MTKVCSKKFMKQCDREESATATSPTKAASSVMSDVSISRVRFDSDEDDEAAKAEAIVSEHNRSEMSTFLQNKLRKDAKRSWDIAYKRSQDRLYKDRHYVDKEFPELANALMTSEQDGTSFTLLECGCGVGNALFPLLDSYKSMKAFALDFSPRAVQMVKDNPLYDEQRCAAFVCDLVNDELPGAIHDIDCALMLFVLSAMAPETMKAALDRVFACVKPGGMLLIRDYARFDLAQLRFSHKSCVQPNMYMRQDNTLSYFFEVDELQRLFESVGFETVRAEYYRRNVTNRKANVQMRRCWVQAVFRKP